MDRSFWKVSGSLYCFFTLKTYSIFICGMRKKKSQIMSYMKESNPIKFNSIPKSNIKYFWKKQLTLTVSLVYLLTERLWGRVQNFLLVLCFWGRQSSQCSISSWSSEGLAYVLTTCYLYTHNILTPTLCVSHLMVRHATHVIKVKVLWEVNPRQFLSISQY